MTLTPQKKCCNDDTKTVSNEKDQFFLDHVLFNQSPRVWNESRQQYGTVRTDPTIPGKPERYIFVLRMS